MKNEELKMSFKIRRLKWHLVTATYFNVYEDKDAVYWPFCSHPTQTYHFWSGRGDRFKLMPSIFGMVFSYRGENNCHIGWQKITWYQETYLLRVWKNYFQTLYISKYAYSIGNRHILKFTIFFIWITIIIFKITSQ